MEEGVGESGRADDYLEVPEEVEGVGESGHAGYLEVPDQAVGTQLMNGSASNIDVDVRGGEPRPLGVEAFGRVGVGTSQTVPGPQWMSASAAEATDAGSSAAGFLLARAFRDILALGSLDTESHQREKCHQMQHNNGARRNQMQHNKWRATMVHDAAGNPKV